MNANKRPKTPRSTENVLHLSEFRHPLQRHRKDAIHDYARRIELVKSRAICRLEDRDAPAVAVAAAFIDIHGNIGTIATAIEPEMAASMASELRTLADILDTHSSKRTRMRRGERGAAALAIVCAIGFAAATYINQLDWLDAVLSIAAQLAAAAITKRPAE